MGMPWQPMHIDTFPFAASALPLCACAGSDRAERSSRASGILIMVFFILRKPADSKSKPLRQATLEPRGDRRSHPLLHLRRSRPQLLVAIDDHPGLEQHGGRARRLEDDEVVVIVHAVLLVGEGLVLPGD